MLARINRIVSEDDFRHISRRGKKFRSAAFTASVLQTGPESPTRFGFITAKDVGGAVLRNTTKRRLRALAAQTLKTHPRGYDVVVRAHSGITEATFAGLSTQWATMLVHHMSPS